MSRNLPGGIPPHCKCVCKLSPNKSVSECEGDRFEVATFKEKKTPNQIGANLTEC